MNYKIINDEQKLKDFIDWLPILLENEKYYVSLFARKKYVKNSEFKSDKAQLKRFVAHKGNLFDKIKQLECEIGSYKSGGQEVPQEALCLYITPTPRDLKKANVKLIKACADLMLRDQRYNPQAEALSCIQKSPSKTRYMDFDIDEKDIDLSGFKKYFSPDTFQIVETNGGYHLLVDPTKQLGDWYKEIYRISRAGGFSIDQTGDQLLPIPGTYQGGFTPNFINL